MAYLVTEDKFKEFIGYRDTDGSCLICGHPEDTGMHDLHRHEAWENANDATW